MAISQSKLAQLQKLIAEARPELFYSWPQWEETRSKVLALDHFECVKCKAKGKYTKAVLVHHVHHLTDRPDLALSIYDADGNRQLISLCRQCHELEHPERLKPAWTAKVEKPLTVERWD